jgi:hypothetical protein
LNPSSGITETVFTISGDNLATTTDYALYWDSGSAFISIANTNEIGHFEGITYTVPLTATSGIYTVTAQLEATQDIVAAAPFLIP